jgi:hypothetical protein
MWTPTLSVTEVRALSAGVGRSLQLPAKSRTLVWRKIVQAAPRYPRRSDLHGEGRLNASAKKPGSTIMQQEKAIQPEDFLGYEFSS